MKLIFVFFFILIPLLVLQGMSLSVVDKKVLFTKKEIAVLKGIATFLVMMSHLAYILLEDRNANINILFSIIQKSGGGTGVLIFFFISGYGLGKGIYSRKDYWKKRLKKTIYPSILLVSAFSCIIQFLRSDIDLRVISHNIFTSAWYIDVIILEYIFFALANDIVKENKKIQLCIIVLLNFLLALVFKMIGLDERWYNAVMLFPFGIWAAYKECEIVCIIRKKRLLVGFTGLIVYVLLGIMASAWKGMPVAVLLKTFAGIALVVGICCAMTGICLNSVAAGYVGKRSLYYYIIHVELIILCSNLEIKSPVMEIWIIIVMTIILGELCYCFFGRYRE